MTTLSELVTPALILDRAVLDRNLAAMAVRFEGTGVRLRPHLKTAKSAEVARRATAGQFGGITVSTLAEAKYFAANGFTDITYAVGLVPSKMAALAELIASGVVLTVLTDDAAAARAIADEAASLGVAFNVLIEIDSGAHRAGVVPDSEALIEIGRVLDGGENTSLAGVLTHAGHSYHADGVDGIKAIAEQERTAVVAASARLAEAGLPCPTVSAGSTPTAVHGESFEGLTEFRPGVYVFFDLDQAGIGSCAPEDVAVSVLASVIGHQPAHGRINIDAGSLALSQDSSANEFFEDTGFGWVMDAVARGRIGKLFVESVNQEHGMVSGGDVPFEDLPVGSRVRVLPNHACITAAAYNKYFVIDSKNDPNAVIETWDRTNGW